MAKSVLILKPSSFGDVIHTLPAVTLIKAAFPESHLDWLVNPEWAPLLEGNPDIRKVIHFPRKNFRGLSGFLNAIPWFRTHIQSQGYEDAIDFQGLLRTALMARFSGAKKTFGLSDAREGATWFYHQLTQVRVRDEGRILHSVERYLKLAQDYCKKLKNPISDKTIFPIPEGIAPKWNFTKLHHRLLYEWINEKKKPLLVIHPYARGAGKSLNEKTLLAFCNRLGNFRKVIVGRGREVELPKDCISFLNETTLAELIWILRQAAFVISVDSGPMHLAAAITNKVLGLHSWSDPRKVGPYQPNAWIWKAGQLVQMKALLKNGPLSNDPVWTQSSSLDMLNPDQIVKRIFFMLEA